MILETPRLRLRRWVAADLEPFAALNADPEVMRFFPAVRSLADSAEGMARNERSFEANGFGFWAMDLPGAGFIGFCGLMVPGFTAPFTPCVEVGWRMARAHWGRGYATEAAVATLDDGFGRIGLQEVVAFTTVGNGPSRRLMERIGMVRDADGDFDHPSVPSGNPLQRNVLYRVAAPDAAAAASAALKAGPG